MKKARIKESGVIIEGFLDGNGHFDVPIDHEIFDRYDLKDLELINKPETREEIAERSAEAVAYLKSHGWVSVESSPDLDEIKNAASALVDAVERYVSPKLGDKYCSRTEILNAKDNLKTLIK